MHVDGTNAALFLLAATALLGSPGPGIAALVSVGRGRGLVGGLRFYGGLQVGLAVAAAIAAGGLFSAISALPGAALALTLAATVYLAYLAYKVATAPVGVATDKAASDPATTAAAGLLLGMTNPKAYVAFMSLMAAYPIVRAGGPADLAVKWLLCVVVMIVVDLAWLWLGAVVGRVALSPRAERGLNLGMGGLILITAVLALI